MNFTNWPSFSSEEVDAVSKILTSSQVNYWTGSHGKKFEEEFSSWVGVKHSIALANGSVALELALKALKLSPEDEVIVSPRSFIASVSSVINIGAIPIFADVNKESGNITAETISKVLTKKTKAIICVHLAGWPCEMSSIMDLANKNDIYVIEDCAQAHGARNGKKSVGSIGHIGTWSFCQDKIISTGGEGGMITTNDTELWKFIWEYKDHGKSYDKMNEVNPPMGFRWLHDSFGTNHRMTEMQSAIGRIQVSKMKSWTSIRNENASRLLDVCNKFPNLVHTPLVPSSDLHAFYKFYTYIKPEGLKLGYSRDRIMQNLNKSGVPTFTGSCSEIYLESAFYKTAFKPKARLPVAKQLGETSLVFLVHPTLSKDDMSDMTDIIEKVFNDAS